jgi:hypothetical protein
LNVCVCVCVGVGARGRAWARVAVLGQLAQVGEDGQPYLGFTEVLACLVKDTYRAAPQGGGGVSRSKAGGGGGADDDDDDDDPRDEDGEEGGTTSGGLAAGGAPLPDGTLGSPRPATSPRMMQNAFLRRQSLSGGAAAGAAEAAAGAASSQEGPFGRGSRGGAVDAGRASLRWSDVLPPASSKVGAHYRRLLTSQGAMPPRSELERLESPDEGQGLKLSIAATQVRAPLYDALCVRLLEGSFRVPFVCLSCAFRAPFATVCPPYAASRCAPPRRRAPTFPSTR